MADPLSLAANVFAILGFSIQSCSYIVTFFERIADTPAEIQHNVVWLRALHSTFSELHALGENAQLRETQIELPSGFKARLEDCQADLLGIESNIRRISQGLEGGCLLQTWTRVKHSFVGEQLLTKFSRRLQVYHTVFTLDMMTIQIKLTVLFNSTRGPKIEASPQQTIASFTDESQFSQFLDSFAEPISVRASTWYSLETCFWRFACWSGPTVKRRWLNKQPVYDITSLKGECGYGFQVYIGKRSNNRGVSIRFTLMKCPQLPRLMSMRWSFFFPQVIPRDSDIFEFVRGGNLEAVKSMFSMRRATPLNTSPDGTGLLHIAAQSGSFEVVKFLIQEGVEVNTRDEEGQTPLHIALSRHPNYDTCRMLLEHGADLGSRDVDGKTPLHTFFNPVVGMTLTNFRGAIDEEIMTPDSSGMTILQYASWSSKSEPLHLIPHLKAGDIYPFLTRDHAGRSLLHLAAQRGNLAILSYILSLPHDVGISIRDTNGQTALHYAMYCKRTGAIDFLISHGAEVGAVDKRGRTVLHCAAARNNLDAIKRVLELCDTSVLHARDREGRTPAKLALICQSFEAAEYLNSITSQEPVLRSHHPPPFVESSTGYFSSLVDYVRRRSSESTGRGDALNYVVLTRILNNYNWRLSFVRSPMHRPMLSEVT